MLKKNLHYLIRCSFLLVLIICLCLSFNSCTDKPEDYFAFLRQDAEYDASVYKNSRLILGGGIEVSFTGEKSDFSMTFTYPRALASGNVGIRICEDDGCLSLLGEQLPKESIPSLWRDIYTLFTPCENILSAKNIDGSTVIEGRFDENGESVLYTLTSDGALNKIEFGSLLIVLNQSDKEDT